MSGFDEIIPREGTASVRHDGRGGYFGTRDVIPLWVADMDFAVPDCITEALSQRLAHPVYGYTFAPDSLFDALMDWMERRHDWKIQREWILLSPGVVPSLHASVLAFCREGEGVIVQPPVYFPFFSSVTSTGRRLILNPLRQEGERYVMDFEQLERCAGEGARLLILCSPHNPVGRVWRREELLEVLRICRQHGVLVLSDEIHADLVYPGYKNLSLGSLTARNEDIITAVAPSKTFNIPGLGLSALIVPDATRRAALRKAFDLLHVGASNPFSLAAFEAAYRGGEAWLEKLIDYLAQTRDMVSDYLARHIPEIRLVAPEGTYLLWLDCRKLGLSDDQLRHFFVHEAKVGMNPGYVFGEGGSGFMRMNIGTPRQIILEALERIAKALGEQRQTGTGY